MKLLWQEISTKKVKVPILKKQIQGLKILYITLLTISNDEIFSKVQETLRKKLYNLECFDPCMDWMNQIRWSWVFYFTNAMTLKGPF